MRAHFHLILTLLVVLGVATKFLAAAQSDEKRASIVRNPFGWQLIESHLLRKKFSSNKAKSDSSRALVSLYSRQLSLSLLQIRSAWLLF